MMDQWRLLPICIVLLGTSIAFGTTAPPPTPMPYCGFPPTPTATPTSTPFGPFECGAATIALEVDPISLPASTGGEIRLRAHAFDANNEPVDNLLVFFRNDFNLEVARSRTGSLIARDGSILEGVAEARLQIPAGVAPEEITVVASSACTTGSASVFVGGQKRSAGRVELFAADTICGSDSGGSIAFRAQIFDRSGRPANQLDVIFITDAGIGYFFPIVQTSETVGNQDGIAETTLRIPPGTPFRTRPDGTIAPYIYRARAGGVEGSVQLFIVPGRERCGGGVEDGPIGPPTTISLSLLPTSARAYESLFRLTLIANVRDAGGRGTPEVGLDFASELGIVGAAAGTTNLAGRATTTVIVPAGQAPGRYRIFATTGDVEAEADFVLNRPPTEIVVTTDTAELPPCSGGTVSIVAQVLDGIGEPMNGLPIEIRADAGTIAQPGRRMTGRIADRDGAFATTLTLPPESAPGEVTITADVYGLLGTTTIEVLPEPTPTATTPPTATPTETATSTDTPTATATPPLVKDDSCAVTGSPSPGALWLLLPLALLRLLRRKRHPTE